jgi:hypothetical protein
LDFTGLFAFVEEKMKKIGFIIFLVTLAVGSILSVKSGVGKFHINFKNGVQGSGNSRTEVRNVSGFEGIKAGGAINLEVSVQKDFKVEVEADDNLLEYIKTETSGNTLKIYTEGRFSTKSRINVRISMPEIKELEISGASNAIISNVKSDSLIVESNGASKIKIDGEAKNLVLEVSGASKVEAEELKVERIDVDANGASKVTVSPTSELKADASGASTIYYTGDPKNVESKTSGASSVKRK